MDFTVLGFMGESNSGKDFCGQWVVDNKGFARVAFADTIKRFIQIVFDFDRENLWGDPKYRNQEIIPCTGGNATASSLMHRHWDQALENMTLNVHNWVNELALTTTEKAEYVKVVGRWFDECRSRTKDGQISARIALQLLGTEFGRGYRDSIWFDYLFEKIIPRINAGEYYVKEVGIVSQRYVTVAGVIITDHRFRNEITRTQERNGYVIKLVRLSTKDKDNEAEEAGIKGHASEAEQRSIPDSAYDLILELGEGAEHVYPRLEQMFQEKEWRHKRTPTTVPE